LNPSAPGQQNTPAYELIKRSLEGELDAFRSLMESQQQYAYVLAFRLLHDEDDAKDVVQEAFIRVWNNLARYKPEVKFTTWLYKIVVNLSYDRMKMDARRHTVVGYVSRLLNRDEIPDGRDVQEEVENVDLSERILAVAAQLPPKQNLVFHLRDVQEFSIEEISEIAGISIGSVKANLCYARKRLRIALSHMQKGERS
jgi:RNA polymerase sigma-70 factor, ECF subfamily